MSNSFRVIVNDEPVVRVSSLELQIVYELYLNSDTDVGDAVFLYTLFREVIRL